MLSKTPNANHSARPYRYPDEYSDRTFTRHTQSWHGTLGLKTRTQLKTSTIILYKIHTVNLI